MPERARERVVLGSVSASAKIIQSAVREGAQGLNFAMTDSMIDVLLELRNRNFDAPLQLYPMIPDVQKYVSIQLKQGTMGVLTNALGSLGWYKGASALVRGSMSVLTMNPLRAFPILVDLELSRLRKAMPQHATLHSVMLHEAVTDLALALDAGDILKTYINHISEKHGTSPGFVTRNFPAFMRFCHRHKIQPNKITIMTPFNPLGFQMTPSRESCEETLHACLDCDVVGISIFAGGEIAIDDAMVYLKTLDLKSICVGVSTESHARETFRRLREL